MRCDYCIKKLKTRQEMMLHLRLHHPNHQPIVCDLCGKNWMCKAYLLPHMEAHLKLSLRLWRNTCSVCGAAFHSNYDFAAHKRTAHEYKCRFCPKVYKVPRKLEQHERSHTGERPFVCETCGLRCISKDTLTNHTRLHSDPKRSYICDVCGKVFPYSNYLNQHRKTHLVEKKLKCDMCDYGANFRSSIERHIRRHFPDVLNFFCPECGAGFTTKTSLNSHSKVHQNQRVPCRVCGKDYINKQVLKRHMLQHQGLRQFKCSLCDKEFIQAEAMRTHMRLVHKALCYKCDMCEQSFRLKTELRQHRWDVHFKRN